MFQGFKLVRIFYTYRSGCKSIHLDLNHFQLPKKEPKIICLVFFSKSHPQHTAITWRTIILTLLQHKVFFYNYWWKSNAFLMIRISLVISRRGGLPSFNKMQWSWMQLWLVQWHAKVIQEHISVILSDHIPLCSGYPSPSSWSGSPWGPRVTPSASHFPPPYSPRSLEAAVTR